MNDFSQRLTAVERRQDWPNVRPKDASSLILVDRSGKEPRVLMGRRHPSHKFMPDVFVFPGGRLERADRDMPVFGTLDPDSERRLMDKVQRPNVGRARGLAAAAIREVYEETGLLLGTRDAGAPEVPSPDWAAFAEHGVFPNLEALTFFIRVITPPRRPKRFDTRFFVADASEVAVEVPGMVGPSSELIELRWVTIPETADLQLMTVTRVVLDELGARVAAGMRPDLPVPFYSMRNGKFGRILLP